MPAKYDYITVAPVTPKGKWTVCVRRVGSRDRYAPVAVCNTQLAADGIVDAMNLMQGEAKKLELPAQRLLKQVRADLHLANQRSTLLAGDKANLNNELREARRQIDRLTQERNIAQAKLKRTEDMVIESKATIAQLTNTLKIEQAPKIEA